MTSADVGRFLLLVALGILAFITFLFAATIVGLMWLESSDCGCLHFPVGLYVLALVGILLLATIISEAIDLPTVMNEWVKKQQPAQLREALAIALVFVVVIFLILL